MGRIHDIRLRSDRFIEQIDSYIETVIDDNQDLLNLNREQLKEEHSTKKGQPIRPRYSKWYAEFKGFETPDLYLTGETQETLTIEAKGKQFNIEGHTEQVPKLIDKYGADIFGIPNARTNEAKNITTKAIADLFKKHVLAK